MWPHRRQPTRLPRPWDSPGRNTGVGCHFLLQCMKVKSESEVTQSSPTLSDPMDCSLTGSSVHGIFQARVLEWGAIALYLEVLISVKKNCYPHPLTPCLSYWGFLHVSKVWSFLSLLVRSPGSLSLFFHSRCYPPRLGFHPLTQFLLLSTHFKIPFSPIFISWSFQALMGPWYSGVPSAFILVYDILVLPPQWVFYPTQLYSQSS